MRFTKEAIDWPLVIFFEAIISAAFVKYGHTLRSFSITWAFCVTIKLYGHPREGGDPGKISFRFTSLCLGVR
jgi:hypothetical protein